MTPILRFVLIDGRIINLELAILVMDWVHKTWVSGFWIAISQFKIFNKELDLLIPFAKTGDLFWPGFSRFRFFVYQGGSNRKDWSK